MESIPCSNCGEGGHKVGRCPELWQNKTPPAERGGDHDEDSLILTISGNFKAQDFNQYKGSRAGQWNPLSVINM